MIQFQPYDSEAWLRQMYIDEMLSIEKIAGICNVNQQTIKHRMKRFGIKTRSAEERARVRWRVNLSQRQTKQISLFLSMDLFNQLHNYAKQNDISNSETARIAIKKLVESEIQ